MSIGLWSNTASWVKGAEGLSAQELFVASAIGKIYYGCVKISAARSIHRAQKNLLLQK